MTLAGRVVLNQKKGASRESAIVSKNRLYCFIDSKFITNSLFIRTL